MPITIPNVILFLALAKLVTQGLKTDHTEWKLAMLDENWGCGMETGDIWLKTGDTALKTGDMGWKLVTQD